MARDDHEVRRVDVGEGVYVCVAAPVERDPVPSPAPSRRVPPVAVLAGGVLAAVALVRLGVTADGLLAAGMLMVLSALAAVDLRARVLPNRIVGPSMLAVLAWQLAFFPDRLSECVLAGAAAGSLLLLPSLLKPGAMGMGDVKLAVLLGLALGSAVLPALLIGFVAVGPVAIGMLVLRGPAARGAALPFGPFLALGAAAVMLV